MNSLEYELSQMNSFEAIKDILNDIRLHDLQCIDVMKMIASKRAIVSYVTGLGKTVLAAAVMRLLWNEDPTRKFIFFGKYDQLTQTPGKLENMCSAKVIAASADAKNVRRLFDEGFTDYNVLFLTHDALRNDIIMNILFQYKDKYCGVFVDEAHMLSNTGNSIAASVIAGMSRQFEYFFALTATPITTDVKQLSKLACMVDAERFPNAGRLHRSISSGIFKLEDEPCFFINRTREEFGSIARYHGIVEWVDPLPHQKEVCGGFRMFELCKGDGAIPQARKLVEVIKDREGKRGLIYVNQHSVRQWILPFLDEAGIKYACVNGNTKMKERAEIMRQFNEEKSLDVVVTSVTTALDLDCDFVVFYEFTVEVKQMIGRAHRGLGNKDLDVIFIITTDTCEIDYFYDNIFSISMEVKSLLHQDFSELEDVDAIIQGY